jgi:predicted metalloendopeptidase
LDNIVFNCETVSMQVIQLVEDLRTATHELLGENDWADEEIKRLVMEKTDAMLVLAGFPDWVSNVSTLDRHYDKV